MTTQLCYIIGLMLMSISLTHVAAFHQKVDLQKMASDICRHNHAHRQNCRATFLWPSPEDLMHAAHCAILKHRSTDSVLPDHYGVLLKKRALFHAVFQTGKGDESTQEVVDTMLERLHDLTPPPGQTLPDDQALVWWAFEYVAHVHRSFHEHYGGVDKRTRDAHNVKHLDHFVADLIKQYEKRSHQVLRDVCDGDAKLLMAPTKLFFDDYEDWRTSRFRTHEKEDFCHLGIERKFLGEVLKQKINQGESENTNEPDGSNKATENASKADL
eukprot:240703_1